MALETKVGEGVARPKEWEASEQETINEFLEERVPTALQGKAVWPRVLHGIPAQPLGVFNT